MDAIAPASSIPDDAGWPPLAALHIGVLHNPGSGANRKAPHAIAHVLAAHPRTPSRHVHDKASVAQALSELAREGVNSLAVSGGDGTLHAVLSVVFGPANPFECRPRLAVLRSGTTNMTASDAGLRGRPDHALASLLERAIRGGDGLDACERHVLRIDAGPGRPPICGMFFGAAAIVQGVEYCTSKAYGMGLRGQIGPGLTLARFALGMARGHSALAPPITVGVTLDGVSSRTFNCWIVQVTTLQRLFLGLRPFWGEEAAPLRYTSVRGHPRCWLRALPGLLRGHRNRFTSPANGYDSHNAQRIELQFDSRFIVDGERFAPTPGSALVFTDGGVASFLQLA